ATTSTRTTTGLPKVNPFPPTIDNLVPAEFPSSWAPGIGQDACGGANGTETLSGQLIVRDEGRTSVQNPESFSTLTATVSWSIAGGESGSTQMTGSGNASQLYWI